MGMGKMTMTVAGMLALWGCATGPEVRASYDHSQNFRPYKTFAFVKPLGTDLSGQNPKVSKYLMAATKHELEVRGLRYDTTSPQLLVDFSANLNKELRVETVPTTGTPYGYNGYNGYGYYGGYNGYYGNRSGAYGAYPSKTVMESHSEGSLSIAVVDSAKKELIWEGLAKEDLTGMTVDDLKPVIYEVVKATFTKYPIAPLATEKR